MAYTVYLRTNKINGKQYVGQSGDFERRNIAWNCLKTKYANQILSKDRREFGLDNFKLEILAEVKTQEEAWELEQKYIKEFNTRYPNGYNMCAGGKTNKGRFVLDSEKEVMKTHITEKVKRAFLEKCTKQVVKLDTSSGELLSLYHSTMDAERDTNIKHNNITYSCKHDSRLAGGFKWMYLDDYLLRGFVFDNRCIKVYQYTLDGKLIKVWKTATEAAKKLGFCQTEIRFCCIGKKFDTKHQKWYKKEQYNGYKWSYEPL